MGGPILITGGAGYIGSHFLKTCLEAGRSAIVLDNLVNGHRAALPSGVPFYQADIRDPNSLREVFARHPDIHGVMHFAAFAEVGESVARPLKYYLNNVAGSLNLLQVCAEHNVKRFVFSSTAATYGVPEQSPIEEDCAQNPINPYGQSKWMFEQALFAAARREGFGVGILRYFNAAGAHPSGEIGEDHEPESHLIPNIFRAATGKGGKFSVFGTDYDTPDGTCVRDYVHVCDLALAHLLLYDRLDYGQSLYYNVGNSQGYSVLEILRAAEQVLGPSFEVPHEFGPRRPGDPPTLVADNRKITRELGWKAKYGLLDMLETAWRWHRDHPRGYASGS